MKITLFGDIALNDLLATDPNQINDKFKALKDSPILSNNISICNLETPISTRFEESDKLDRRALRVTTREVLRTAFNLLRLDIVSIANNHILDAGTQGLNETISFLNESGYLHSGIRSKNNSSSLAIYYTNEKRIGFLAYVHTLTNPFAKYYDKSLNTISSDGYISGIEGIKEKNNLDLLILSIHWGRDFSNFFEKWQQELAHKLIDRGVDVIMGHHPHTIQPYEIYRGKPIFYSLGSLCFGDFYWEGKIRSLKRKTKLGIIAVINEEAKILDIIPTREKKGNYVYLPSMNLKKKLCRLYWWNKLKNKYKAINFLILFKEAFTDRLYEFFGGYYRNPIRDLLSIHNLKKIKFILRDIRR